MRKKIYTTNTYICWQYERGKAMGLVIVIVTLAMIFTLSSCAAGPGSKYSPENRAGFWVGFWHGFIWIVTLIIRFFSENVRVYEINNTGSSYNVGFVLGIVMSISVIGAIAKEKMEGLLMEPNTKASLLKKEAAELAYRGDYRAAIKQDLKALRIFEKTGYDRARVATHIALGRMYLAVGDLTNAQDHLQTSYRDSQRPGYKQFLLESAELLGEFMLRNGQAGEALGYFKKSIEIEEEETTGIKAGTKSVPMPGPSAAYYDSRAIIGRLPLEITLCRLHCVLSRANVARALLASGKIDQAISALVRTVSSLKEFPQQIDPERNVEMEAAQIYATMELGRRNASAMDEAISSLKDSVQELISRAEHDLEQSEDSIAALEQVSQMFLGFRQQVAGEIRRLIFPS